MSYLFAFSCCSRGSQGKNTEVTLQETDPDLPVSVQESLVKAWVSGHPLQGQEYWVQPCEHRTFWRRSPYLHHLHHSWVSGQTTGRKHSPAHLQKIWLKIYWGWLRPSEQDPVSPTVSLFHQEASINFLSLSIRGQTEWKPQSQTTNQTNHMDHSLV